MKLVYFAYLFVAVTAFGKSSHSINLMWINSKLKEDQELVCPASKPCLEQMLEWAKDNPHAEVNFWFDSETTSASQLKKTRTAIERASHIISIDQDVAPVNFRDIRDLPNMKDLLGVYSDSRIPVYFRADLARAIVLHDLASEGSCDNIVYADIDIPSLTQRKLFDSETRKNLDGYGIVMARFSYNSFENGFQIVRSKHTPVLQAMKHVIIDLNKQRVHNACAGKFYTEDKKQPKIPFEPIADVVFRSYRSMFAYLYHRQGLGQLQVGYRKEHREIYDEDKHGLQPFGLCSIGDRNLDFTANPGHEELEGDGFPWVYVPTKEVNYPLPSLNYIKDIQ